MLYVMLLGCMSFPGRNFAPAIVSMAPEDGAVVNESESVLFTIMVEDPDTPASELSIRLESDQDGLLQLASPDSAGLLNLSVSTLSVGEHLLTTTVEDSSNNFITAQWSIVVNALPEIETPQFLPANPTTVDDVQVIVPQVQDLEDQTVSLTYIWYKNGALQPQVTGATLPSTETHRDEIWLVDVTPNDGYGDGEVYSASVSIQNTVPQVNSVSISPSTDVVLDTALTCTAQGSDADEDTLTASYLWQILSDGNFLDASYTGDTFTPDSAVIQPGDQIWCSATVEETDGLSSEREATFVTVENRPPTVSDVSIYVPSGEPVRAGTTLQCLATVEDPDNSPMTLTYRWIRDGLVLSIDDGLTQIEQSQFALTTSNAQRGDAIECQVTVTDAFGDTDMSSSQASVENTAPTLVSVGMLPIAPTSQDDITCIPVATDIDGDTLAFNYVWSVDGNVVSTGTSDVLNGPFASGAEVSCSVTPDDQQSSDNLGNTLDNAVVVVNTPPVINSITLSPDPVTTNDLLLAQVDATDIDGDTVVLYYDWYVGGVLVQDGQGNGLNGGDHFDRNDQVIVHVTPSDLIDAGSVVFSDLVTIENAPPTLSEVGITQNPLPTVTDLVCEVGTPTDPDGDSFTYTFSWTRNGIPYTGGLLTTNLAGDTIDGDVTVDGDSWQCTVEVSDGISTDSVSSEPVDVVCQNGYGELEACPALSCNQILAETPTSYGQDGVYWLTSGIGSDAFEAYCDMSHSGGGWTLVLKTTSADSTFYYDSPLWDTEVLTNSADLSPNTALSSSSSKFESYNATVADDIRLEFIAPFQHNIHHYGMGSCSTGISGLEDNCGTCTDQNYTTEADCVAAGVCSDGNSYGTESDCLANSGSCSDASFGTLSACEGVNEVWTSNNTWTSEVWNDATWTPASTALELFQGGEIRIEGDESPSSCPSGLILREYTDDMMISRGRQFFGVNGEDEFVAYATNGNVSWRMDNQMRFGIGSGGSSNSNVFHYAWQPQIGIGMRYHKSTSGSDPIYEYSAAWVDPWQVSGCGSYGNGIGVNGLEGSGGGAVVNLWVR